MIPVVGPTLGNIVGSILTAGANRGFREKVTLMTDRVKAAAESAVKTIWSSIKSTGQKIKNTMKNFCDFLFS